MPVPQGVEGVINDPLGQAHRGLLPIALLFPVVLVHPEVLVEHGEGDVVCIVEGFDTYLYWLL